MKYWLLTIQYGKYKNKAWEVFEGNSPGERLIEQNKKYPNEELFILWSCEISQKEYKELGGE